MKIDRIVNSVLDENTYILEKDNNVLIIDPGSDGDIIKNRVKDKKIEGILITHKHFDHVGSLSLFKEYNIYSYDNLEEKEYKINNFIFDVIYNPGHSKDSISFYFKEDNILFSGDFIFKESISRVDLPTGNIDDMNKSIKKISKYSKDMVIYPGHGEETTLGYEIENNIYFREVLNGRDS